MSFGFITTMKSLVNFASRSCISSPAERLLAVEFEEQTTRLLRKYNGDGENRSVQHPDKPDAQEDAPLALAFFGAERGSTGELMFV